MWLQHLKRFGKTAFLPLSTVFQLISGLYQQNFACAI